MGKPQSEKLREAVSHTEGPGSVSRGYRRLGGSQKAMLQLQCLWAGGYELHSYRKGKNT